MEAARVARIFVQAASGDRVGSGYLVSPGVILTAAHVVTNAPAEGVTVELDVGGPASCKHIAVGIWEDQKTDLAFVRIPAGPSVTPEVFGHLPRDRDVTVDCVAIGFPWWKRRESEGTLFRDSERITGNISSLANRREGTLEIAMAHGPDRGDDSRCSPWAGASGAAVFVNDRIVGVVAEHHRAEGPLHLSVRTLRAAYDSLTEVRLKELCKELRLPSFPGGLDDVSRPPRVRFTAPSLPRDFIPRHSPMEGLLSTLVDRGSGEPFAGVVALLGTGGFGKTSLAKAVCHDEQVRNAFKDGVLWVELGEHPGDLTGRVEALVDRLALEQHGYSSTDAASERLAELLADRDILMVIDDVWNAAHLKPFLQGGPRCARLITTRNAQTLPVGAREFHIDKMTPEEATALVGFGLQPDDEAAALTDLAHRLGEWPLLLKLANGTLRRRTARYQQPLPDALAFVNKAYEQRGVSAFDMRDPKARDHAVSATMEVGIEQLLDKERARYLELAVFPGETDIPLCALEKLWGATGGLDALAVEELADLLKQLSLILQFNPTARTIRVHDIVRRYLYGLEGNRSRIPHLHGLLLEAYKDRKPWHELSDDGYLYRRLAWHLREAGRVEELEQLLCSYRWIAARLKIPPISDILSDYDLLDANHELRLIHGALRLSAHVLASRPAELPSQILGRLLDLDSPRIRELCRQAVLGPRGAWLRPLRASLAKAGGPLLRTLEGHVDSVTCVALTGDGRRAISGSRDGMLKVWNLETGASLLDMRQAGEVTAVAVTPDGKRALSCSAAATLSYLDLENGTVIYELRWGTATLVAVSPDGKRAVSASDEKLTIWDLQTGSALRDLPGAAVVQGPRFFFVGLTSGFFPTAYAVTPDARRAVAASADGTLKVLDLEVGVDVCVHRTRPTPKRGENRPFLFALGWYSAKRGQLKVPPGTMPVSAIAVTCDGTRAVVAEIGRCNLLGFRPPSDECVDKWEPRLRVWDLEDGAPLVDLAHAVIRGSMSSSGEGPRDVFHEVSAVAVTPDGKRAISASDRELKVWDLETGAELLHLRAHTQRVTSVVVTPDGKRAVSSSGDRTLRIWDLEARAARRDPAAHEDEVTSVAVTPDGRRGVSGSKDQTVKVWDLESGTLVFDLVTPQTFADRLERSGLRHEALNVMAVAVTADGKRAVAVYQNHSLMVWDLETGSPLRGITSSWSEVDFVRLGRDRHVAVTADGTRVISTYFEHTLTVRDPVTLDSIHDLSGHTGSVTVLAVTSDGKRAISGSEDQTLKVWDLETGAALDLAGHAQAVEAVAVTPDGKRAVSASADGMLKVWDLETGTALLDLVGHAGSVSTVAVTPDGKCAVSGSDDRKLKVWDLQTSAPLLDLAGHSGSIAKVAVTPDGKYVISASDDNTIKMWDLETGEVLVSFTGNSAITSLALGGNTRILAGDRNGEIHLLTLEYPRSLHSC